MKKYMLIALLSIMTTQTTLTRNLTITNPSDHKIMVLPLWSGQGIYDILLSPTEISYKLAKKTYSLGLHTVQRVSWVYIKSPLEKIKYYVDIAMGPIGSDKTFVIYNNGSYSYRSNNESDTFKKAEIANLSDAEKKLLS